ncbi:hypothetical protein [Ohtaekwangia sp.]|uniref:hypothetical protein n=1 Tax=Ohtaekwangia sp. TaxID=2066019 RepID=UPI002FDD20FE
MKLKIPAYLLLCVVLLTALTSCHDDDNKGARTVEGKWQGTLLEAKILVLSIPVQTRKDDTFNAILEFQGSGNLTVQDDGTTASGRWEQNGETVTITSDFTIENINFSGNYTVKERTDTKLTLYVEKEETYKDPDTGAQITGTVQATFYFVAI